MDLKKVMVLIDGKDQTEKIYSAEIVNNKVKIIFTNSDVSYSYNLSRVMKLQNPSIIEPNGRAVYVGNMPVYMPEILLCFGEYTRIFYNNGKSRTELSSSIHIVENDASNINAENILNYLINIAEKLPSDNDEDCFLLQQMKNLTFVHPESVLGSYLNNNSIKNNIYEAEDVIYPFSFNLSQKVALENALANSISVIDGPPGTGKTQTILNIISNLVLRGKTVAVVSGNNEAVKNVKEKLEKKELGFLTALLGRKRNKQAFFGNMPKANVSGWDCVETKEQLILSISQINSLLNSLMMVDRKRAQIKQELEAWKLEQEHFENYYVKQDVGEISRLPLINKSPDKILEFLADTYIAYENNQVNKFWFKLKLMLKYRIFDYNKLKENDVSVILKLEREFYGKQIEKLEASISELDKKLRTNRFEELLSLHQSVSDKYFCKHLHEKYSNGKMCDFDINNYKSRFDGFVDVYPVILSTTHSLRMSIPTDYLLDYVIIDEASQVDLITGVLTLSCCKNLVVVGDLKQLPQIVDKKIEKQLTVQNDNLIYDYFTQNILSSMIELYGDDLPRVILKEHYRCHPKIIGFCNKKYYDNQLISYTDNTLSDRPLVLYRTAKGNHMRRVTKGQGKGTYNQREIDVIDKEILFDICENTPRETIGIVTPYRKQADNTRQMISDDIYSDTVHKYQGREKDIIIMSTVLDTTQSGQLGLEFVDDPQMVNVAVSRAVRQFVLVTDNELFCKKGDNISDLIRYIMYSTLDDNVVESDVVSVFDLLYNKYSERLNLLKSKLNNKAKYKSEEIIRVLLEELLLDDGYNRFSYTQNLLLKNLISDVGELNDEEIRFVNNRASLDFVVYYKQDKTCVLVIEVDGFAFHENNPEQLRRDKLKDSILNKYNIPLLRLPTNGSGEKQRIITALNNALEGR